MTKDLIYRMFVEETDHAIQYAKDSKNNISSVCLNA
jgi:hypothetical protein